MSESFPRDKRNSLVAPVIFSKINTETFYSGVMHNCSNGGIFFKTDFPLDPGTKIYFEILYDHKKTSTPVFYDGYRAEVIWRKTIANGYSIGIKYYEQVNRKDYH